MLPDTVVPPSRPATAPPSSRNAVRGGVLAALSSPPAAAQAPSAPAAVPAQHAPARGFGALLRAAGRRGLRGVRPVVLPILNRVQARIRTAINESDVAARTTSIEQALAKLSERLDTEIASRRDIADLRRLVAEDARRLDALRREVADVGEAANAAVVQRLDAVQQGVAAIPDAMRAGTARRAPIPLGGEVMAWTPDGYLLLPAEDLRLLAAMSEGGVLEHGTRLVLAALLEPGGAFLDVGAHVGTMALLGARRVGEHGRVFAVEPLPRLAALLRRSLALNDLADRVSVAACAAGEADAEGLLHLGEVLGHSSLLPLPSAPNAEAVRVPVRRIDDVVPPGTRIDVAKIDAEGCELQVWRGMRRVLEESPRLAAVLECGPSHLARAGTTPEAWLGELEAASFASYTIDEATGACRPASAPALAGVFSTNVLLLRPGAAARHPGLVFA